MIQKSDLQWNTGNPPGVVSAVLREGKNFWVAAGAAGGSELPPSAEPYAMRVALPVALAKAIGLSAHAAAEMAGGSEGFVEEISGMRWLRWSVELAPGTLEALGLSDQGTQLTLARALGQAVGCPLFARFELSELKGDGSGDWAAGARAEHGAGLLFSVLEAKALAEAARPAPRGAGPGRL